MTGFRTDLLTWLEGLGLTESDSLLVVGEPITVRSNDPDMLRCCRLAFGEPKWHSIDTSPARPRTMIAVAVSTDEYQGLLRRATEAGSLLGHRHLTHRVPFREYVADGGRVLVGPDDDPELVALYGDLLVAVVPEGPLQATVAARHLRALRYWSLVNAGYVCFHSSGAVVDGVGVLIVGDSGGGKTTTGLSLGCLATGAYVANERVLVRAGADGGLTMVGIPSPIRVGKGSLLGLGWDEPSARWDLMVPRPGTPGLPPRPADAPAQEDKLEVLPGELTAFAGIQLAQDVPVVAVIAPNVSPEPEGPRAVPAEPSPELLRRNCYTPYDPVFVDDWMSVADLPWYKRHIIADNVMRRLTDLPWFAATHRIGTPSAATAESLRDLLVRLRDSGGNGGA